MKLKVLIGILSSLLLSESSTFPSMEFLSSSLALSLNISSPGRGDLPGFYAVLLILLAHSKGDHSWSLPRSESFQQKAEMGGSLARASNASILSTTFLNSQHCCLSRALKLLLPGDPKLFRWDVRVWCTAVRRSMLRSSLWCSSIVCWEARGHFQNKSWVCNL